MCKKITLGHLTCTEFPHYNAKLYEQVRCKQYKPMKKYCAYQFPDIPAEEAENLITDFFVWIYQIVSNPEKIKDPNAVVEGLIWEFFPKKCVTKVGQVRRKLKTDFSIGNPEEDDPNIIDPPDPKPLPDEIVEFDECHERLRCCLNQLEKKKREMVKRHFFEGMTYTEIGELYGVGKVTVHKNVRCGMTKLRKCLEQQNAS